MESLEILLQKRIRQCDFEAMMIPRYLENPNAFIGKNTKTLEDAKKMEKESKKCRAVLKYLKEYRKLIMKTAIVNLGGEDYSVEYENQKDIYSVQNMSGKEIELTDELEKEIIEKLLK